MLVRLSTAIAAICTLSGRRSRKAGQPTDSQIAHIAYTAGQLDIDAAKAGHIEIDEPKMCVPSPRIWCATIKRE